MYYLFSCSNCPSFGHHELFQLAPGSRVSLTYHPQRWLWVSILTNSPSGSGAGCPRTALWAMWLQGVPGALQTAESHPFFDSLSEQVNTDSSFYLVHFSKHLLSVTSLPPPCQVLCWMLLMKSLSGNSDLGVSMLVGGRICMWLTGDRKRRIY